MGLQIHELHLVIIESKSLITNDFIHQFQCPKTTTNFNTNGGPN